MTNNLTVDKKHNSYGWYVVLISAIIGISMTASFPQFTMVVDEYAIRTGVSKEFLLFTDTVKSISIMVSMLLSGPVYKKLGLKKAFALAILAMVVPQVILPYVTDGMLVLLLKIIQGFCAIIFPVFIINIMDWMDKNQIGTATAVFNGIFYGGSGLGATAAGFTIASMGWVASFHMIAIMTLLPSLVWFFTVKEANKVEDSALERGRKSGYGAVIKSPITWILIICLFSTIWMVQVLSVDLPLYGEFFGYDAGSVGLIMSSLSFGIFFASIISGRISDFFAGKSKKPSRARLIVFSLGPVLTVLSIMLLFAIDKSNFTLFYGAILLLSFSSAWGLGSFYCILPELMEKSEVEYATGFVGGIADLAMPIGPFVVGVIFGVKGLWTPAWASCIAICLFSVVGCVLLFRKK